MKTTGVIDPPTSFIAFKNMDKIFSSHLLANIKKHRELLSGWTNDFIQSRIKGFFHIRHEDNWYNRPTYTLFCL